MRVLVAYASRHGSTEEIASEIASTLAGDGIAVHVSEVGQVLDISSYDAAVIGSAIYLGRWMRPARDLVDICAPLLPTWLFSSGPLSAPNVDGIDPVDGGAMLKTGARGHVTFGGRLASESLDWYERSVIRLVHAPLGDHRDWQAIRDWALSVRAELLALQTGSSAPAVS